MKLAGWSQHNKLKYFHDFFQAQPPSLMSQKSLSANSKQRLSPKQLQIFPSPRSEEAVTEISASDAYVADLLCE